MVHIILCTHPSTHENSWKIKTGEPEQHGRTNILKQVGCNISWGPNTRVWAQQMKKQTLLWQQESEENGIIKVTYPALFVCKEQQKPDTTLSVTTKDNSITKELDQVTRAVFPTKMTEQSVTENQKCEWKAKRMTVTNRKNKSPCYREHSMSSIRWVSCWEWCSNSFKSASAWGLHILHKLHMIQVTWDSTTSINSLLNLIKIWNMFTRSTESTTDPAETGQTWRVHS